MATPGGRLQLDPGAAVRRSTTQADGMLTGSFKIAEDGYYHVELDGPARREGHRVAEVHDRRDRRSRADGDVREAEARHVKANPVEEVFLQARADDDFGVKQLDLVYSVNGGAEKTVTLYGKGAKPLDGGQRRPHACTSKSSA